MKKKNLILAHHANQYLIGNGYKNREGLSEIAQGYASVLHLHELYQIPLHLHLSGTLIEALAWSCPWFLTLATEMRAQGLIEFIGGTYSENITPCFRDEYNRRQIEEYLEVFERHLGEASILKTFWVPERVWQPNSLSRLITQASLRNGGYSAVWLDQRLCFGSRGDLTRTQVDEIGPWSSPLKNFTDLEEARRETYLDSFRVHRMASEEKLRLLPISEHSRYWIPPRTESDFASLNHLVENLSENSVLIFADDLERTAGVAGWEKSALTRYENFLRWAKDETLAFPFASNLKERAISAPTLVEAGTFYELATTMGAGEDYAGWLESDDNIESRAHLEKALSELEEVDSSRMDPALFRLAWKHALASGYETYWHDLTADQVPRLAPWAKALASHARHLSVILQAGRWSAQPERRARLERLDVNRDGHSEFVVQTENFFAVLAPEHGGRLTWLFAPSTLLVGNPTDDWNWQTDLNAFMQIPPNHPGAFVELGCEQDRFEILQSASEVRCASVRLTLINVEPRSSHRGLKKTFIFEGEHVRVEYELAKKPQVESEVEVVCGLSPDYLTLIKSGGRGFEVLELREPAGLSVKSPNFELIARFKNAAGTAWRGADFGHGYAAHFVSNSLRFAIELELR